ncbi:MAG: hypothetical protein JNG89_01215 [Planctomycetaceae bacterium]|nr:hypothetical protein [Planctomycetaceae bacterium]
MRLTLRTLLAYLDDILEPADAREIGAKIAESSVAAATVSRIRDVMRKRRITSPELTGPGSGPDPNLVAEYLDNTLTPEHVTEIERLCLESDIHLAETAGCHQILTIVLGEPVDIPPRTRERMYALGAIAPAQPQDGDSAIREPVPPATADTRRNAAAAAASVQTGDETFTHGVPDYLRRKPLWKRLLPAAAVLLLLVWLAWVISDLSIRNLFRASSGDEAIVADAAPPAPESKNAPERAVVETPEAVAVTPVEAPAGSINPAPPADLPESPVEPAADPAVDSAVVTVEPARDAAAAAVDVVPAEPAPPVVVDLPTPVVYTSLEGIALTYQADIEDWNVLERQQRVLANQWIGVPDPFLARFEVAAGRTALIVNPGTSVQFLMPSEGRLLSVQVDHGRIGISRTAGEGAAPDPVLVSLQIGAWSFDVELVEPGTLLGVEVLLRQPTGIPAEPVEPTIDGGVFVVAGSAAVKTGDNQQIVLSADNGFLPWPVDGVWQPGPLLSQPQWLTPDGPILPPVKQTFANLYERLFTKDQPVSVSIPAVVKDRRRQISEFAVETLALTQNIPHLLQALQAEHDESRHAAIVGLREWLPRSSQNADILREELSLYYQDDEVEPIYELLWGYSLQDFRSLEVSERLIGWLSHDNLVIRELAIYQIRTGTNRPTDYHPMALAEQRQAAIARLQEAVRRYGALMPAE